jgi:hypothetical protein
MQNLQIFSKIYVKLIALSRENLFKYAKIVMIHPFPCQVIPDLIRNLFLKQIDPETIAFGKERITGSY